MITKEQYEEYKKLVEEYEQAEYEEKSREAEAEFAWEDEDDEEDLEERRENERAEIAANCTCGAWGFNKSGFVYHVADCICGAE